MAAHPLDNAVWHSIAAADPALVERAPGAEAEAARYLAEVSPFGAITDDPGPRAWDDLARLVGPDGVAVLFRREVEVPSSWIELERLAGVQMVADRVEPAVDDSSVVALGAADVPEMLELVRATRPGPFGKRTVELGDYLGIREAGRLVAMAGERLRPAGFTEISAVCTHPDVQGRGLATRLVRLLASRIMGRGEQAFLHAAAVNEPAIRLYTSLGFETRCLIDAVVVRAPSL